MSDSVGGAFPRNPLVVLGSLVVFGTALGIVLLQRPPRVLVVQATLPLAIGGGLLVYGWVMDEQLSEYPTRMLVTWIVVGVAAFTVVGFWFGTVSRLFDTSYLFAVIGSLSTGAVFGAAIGVYAARVRSVNANLQARTRELERYEHLVDRLPVGVYRSTAGQGGQFRLLNEAMVEMFDADSTEALEDHAVSDLYADPDDREQLATDIGDTGIIEDEELRLETLSGDRLWGSVTAIAVDEGDETVFDGALVDITERKEYEQRLEEQRDDLEVLNQVVRHDIRNDLQLVVAHTSLLKERIDGELEDHVEAISESAENAIDLTTTAREMADVMLTAETERQRVRLRPVLEGEVDEIRTTYPDAAVTVDETVPDVTVRANEMLDSVFRNLLKNAVQHNDTEVPEVTVTATADTESVVVRVADNGPGVPDDQKETIFGRGEKGLDSTGTGIGLYLVQTLVESYGGDITVADNDPEGAVFTVELPTADTSAKERPEGLRGSV